MANNFPHVSRQSKCLMRVFFASLMTLFAVSGLAIAGNPDAGGPDRPHAVFLIGDREYRSEESMPMLASILRNRHGFDVTLCFSVSDEGVIDPNRPDYFRGIEALANADLMVVFMSWRQPGPEQLGHITNHLKSGGAVVGFRPTVLTFDYPQDHHLAHLNKEWPHEVLGLRWIKHHGHKNSTDVFLHEDQKSHPVLRGVRPFHARSWLYYAADHVHRNVKPLMIGRAVRGAEPGGEHFGEPQAVAWTHQRQQSYGGGRTFFTTLGDPEDFHQESMRRLAIQGMFWAMGMEEQIPKNGLNVDFVMDYKPNRSGFGKAYKQNLRPEDIPLDPPATP
jgi:type 1 glutamine amidotransferase